MEKILPLRQRQVIQDQWLLERLETVLPAVMERAGLDMWLVVAREYNEDPVMMSLFPATMMSARRRTMLVFYRGAERFERLAVARYAMKPFYESVWTDTSVNQWERLRQVVAERNPQRIGVNTSLEFAFGDGLSHTEHALLMQALGPELGARVVSGENVALGWLETRTESELAAYPGIAHIAHSIIAEGFSRKVIHPGVTTADDVVWWFRQRMLDLGLKAWFHPTVTIHRQGSTGGLSGDATILPGDLLHCDVGFEYLGRCTDHQQNAYVLKPGELDAPEGLKGALASGNRLQDILASHFEAGRTGNEILALTLAQAKSEGLKPCVYTHPLGFHGHAAGTTIGLWDQQGGVPGRGDYPLYDRTVHSSELNVMYTVPEWGGQEVMMALEEDMAFVDGQTYYLDGRQTRLHLI